jgi:thioredoxin reductase (NADPH)
MHNAAVQREMVQALGEANGWVSPPTPEATRIEWSRLQESVEMHIRSLNFGYTSALRKKDVTTMIARARIVAPHTVECTNKKGVVTTVKARRILLATGGRPALPDIPGAKELGITSDDIFRQSDDPGKTLVVGASYVALECAGMLHGIGREATVMMRSIPLRGFDTDMANRLVNFMEAMGVRFIKKAVPVALTRNELGSITVDYKDETGATHQETYNTVLFATGRRPETKSMGLEEVGVKLAPDGKVITDKYDRTSVPHIYAIGDIAAGGLELTPVAIRAGNLLADRLYNKGTELMSYETVPTTVFTPLEYGCVGYSEDRAQQLLGDNLEVYHTCLTPLSWSMAHLYDNTCYMKLLVDKRTDRVVGFHVLAPEAGEITQGVAVALRAGATKAHFDSTVGIHPTLAEDMTLLKVTKASGEPAEKTGC